MSKHGFESLPVGSAPQPLSVPHFPDALHAAVFRNWDLVPCERLARVLGGTPGQIAAMAASMGLPPQRSIPDDEPGRSYVTVIRRNWHLMPYDQLGELLGWDADRFDFLLREDDVLWVKLGNLKPQCPRLQYRDPDSRSKAHCEIIRTQLHEALGDRLAANAEPPFEFVRQMSKEHPQPSSASVSDPRFSLRMLYPYFLRYADPLAGSAIDDVTDGYLAELSRTGVNALWLHCVLNTVAPWDLAPELSAGSEERLANLRKLCLRARRFGMGVYLYLNEPRSMPAAFFEAHPELRGVPENADRAGNTHGYTLCTSTPAVQRFLVDSVENVFTQVPELEGAFTITYSENLTNCCSRRYADADACPRCRARGDAKVIAEVNRLIGEGMWKAKPEARLLVWDWGWPEDWVEEIVANLPKKAWLMRVSEWGTPFTRGDFASQVGEYSISVVGPSEISRKRWELARRHGLKTAAKIQATCTWELSSLPYLPAISLVAQHAQRLCEANVDGVMMSWTLGGYSSPNLRVISKFLDKSKLPTADAAMLETAQELFGQAIAAEVVQTWKQFGEALSQYPFHLAVVYYCPVQMGVANPLFATPTGYAATMTGIPYDDLDEWRGPYSRDTFRMQFERVASGWKRGADQLNDLLRRFPSPALREHARVATAAWIHFQSTANQIRFVQVRQSDAAEAVRILHDEIALACQMHDLVAEDSRLGFEATNHYFYVRFDLLEKILNCRSLMGEFDRCLAPAGEENGKVAV